MMETSTIITDLTRVTIDQCVHKDMRAQIKRFYCAVNKDFRCGKCHNFQGEHKICTHIKKHNLEVVKELGTVEEKLQSIISLNEVQKVLALIEEVDKLIEERRKDKDDLISEIKMRLDEDFDEFMIEANKLKNMFKDSIGSVRATCADVISQLDVVKKARANLGWNPETKAMGPTAPSIVAMIEGHNFLLKVQEDTNEIQPHDFSREQKHINALRIYKRDGLGQTREFVYDKLGKHNEKKLLYSVTTGGAQLLRYNVHNKKSKRLQMNGIFPLQCGVAATKDTLYIAGGTRDYVQHFNTVLSLDLQSLEPKEQLPPMKVGRSENSLACLANFLIVVGGRDNNGYTRSIDVLDLKETNKSWKCTGLLDHPRGFAAVTACELQRKIYIFGGLVDGDPVNYMHTFDPFENKLTSVTLELPALFSAGMVCAGHDKDKGCNVMIFGGRTSLTEDSDKVFCWRNGKVEPMKELCRADSFYGQLPAVELNQVVAIGSKYLHRFGGDKAVAFNMADWSPL